METVQVPGIMDGGRKVGILRSYVEDHPDRLHREGETVLGGADFQPEAPQSYSRKRGIHDQFEVCFPTPIFEGKHPQVQPLRLHILRSPSPSWSS